MLSNVRAAEASIPDAFWSDLKAEGLLREDAPT
jgi:D-threo-aldose 1-dehydrogenase